MAQASQFVISKFTNPSGEIVFRVTGWLVGKRIRKNFSSRAVGGPGLFAIITLERLNAFVGLLVGLATLVYLCLRIRDAVRKHGNGRSGRSGPESDDEG